MLALTFAEWPGHHVTISDFRRRVADAAGDLEHAEVAEPIKVHAAAAARVKWGVVCLGYVGPARVVGPSSWKDSEEARCREEQRWLREE